MFCDNCGTKLPDNAKFCGDCGRKVVVQQPAQATETSWADQPASSAQAYTPVAQPTYQQGYSSSTAYTAPAYQVNEPLRVGQYVGMFLLMCIPIVNIVLLFIWGFDSSINLNKKNFARAVLILYAIMIGFWIVFGAVLFSFILSMFNNFGGYYY